MWLQRAIRWVLPDEAKLYDYVDQAAAASYRCAELLVELLKTSNRDTRQLLVERIRDAEHDGDKAMKDMTDALDQTFVTPIDREDLYTLTNKIESVSDVISATATYISVHQMDSIPAGSRELGEVIMKCAEQFRDAARMLRDHRQAENVRAACRSLHYLEHEADVIFRMRLGDLFAQEKDAIQLIKHKEFLEGLENTVDACAAVGRSMETILIKNS
jgi:hypothetical protein